LSIFEPLLGNHTDFSVGYLSDQLCMGAC